jgi:hypothetical protein
MKDDFNQFDKIVLRPYSANVEYQFDFPNNSAETASDGYLPFGTVLTSASAVIYDEGNNLITDMLQGSPALSGSMVTLSLSYPSAGEGRYEARFTLMDNNIHYQANFSSIFAYSDG